RRRRAGRDGRPGPGRGRPLDLPRRPRPPPPVRLRPRRSQRDHPRRSSHVNADLQSFWESTRAELDRVDPAPRLEPAPAQSAREYATESVVLTGYGGVRLRGWYSVPKDRPRGGRFPAILAVPGYSGEKAIPALAVLAGFAVLTLF